MPPKCDLSAQDPPIGDLGPFNGVFGIQEDPQCPLSAPQVPKNDPRDPWVSPYGTPRSLFWALWVTLGPLMSTHEPYKTPGTPQGRVGPPWDTRVSLLGSPCPPPQCPLKMPRSPKMAPCGTHGSLYWCPWDAVGSPVPPGAPSSPKRTHGSPHVCPNPPPAPPPALTGLHAAFKATLTSPPQK